LEPDSQGLLCWSKEMQVLSMSRWEPRIPLKMLRNGCSLPSGEPHRDAANRLRIPVLQSATILLRCNINIPKTAICCRKYSIEHQNHHPFRHPKKRIIRVSVD
jgi:hypothetical protein